MRKHIHHVLAILILTLVVLFLLWRNYVPGTTLAGWDDLHHEFDFTTAFARTLQGVWRADQGLGTVAGHSHMSDIPRIGVLWLLALIFPTGFVRFAFVAFGLMVGVYGMYTFVFATLRNPSDAHLSNRILSLISVVSTFLYVFNLGVVQQFILPFEMFIVQFALLPWLLYGATQYLRSRSYGHLMVFAILSCMYSATAYAAMLWYVYFGIFTLWIIFQKTTTQSWRHIILLLGVCIITNLYWILPNMYFVKNYSTEVRSSKINTIFSPDMFAANKRFGNVPDALLLKGFLFDWTMYDFEKGTFNQILEPWRRHLASPFTQGAGYLLSFVGISGMIVSLWKKDARMRSYAVWYIIPILLILNGIWPIDRMYEWLSTLSPTLYEALRTPFTKVSILAGFGLSLFAGYFMVQIVQQPKRIAKITIALIIASLIWFSLPAFNGGYIHRLVQVQIPQEYSEMFQYFRTQPQQARVALFPIHTFWNWTYYQWGYQGAGFMQFGIPQPILDRDYDRWSASNEQYTREMSYAAYSGNPDVISAMIHKYDIRYVVLDKNVIDPGLPTQQSLLTWELADILGQTQLFDPPLLFGDDILVYKRKVASASDVYFVSDIPTVISPNERLQVDETYLRKGAYISPAVISPSISGSDDMVVSKNAREINLLNMPSRWGICSNRKEGIHNRTYSSQGIQYESQHVSLCESFTLSNILHDGSYVLSIESTNISGKPIYMCVKNLLTNHCDIVEQLSAGVSRITETFWLPNVWDFGSGYQIELSNLTRGDEKSVNIIHSMKLSESIKRVVVVPQNNMLYRKPLPSVKSNTYMRVIPFDFGTTSDLKTAPTLVFTQRYDPGWVAIAIQGNTLSGMHILPHVKINGWSNGWLLPKSSVDSQQLPRNTGNPLSTQHSALSTNAIIFLLFWPQVLEYVGIGLLLLTLGILTLGYVQIALNSRDL